MAVTGAVAAGTSTLADVLANRLGWRTHLEGHIELDNPFFARAEVGAPGAAFASQVHFLLASADGHRVLSGLLVAPAAGSDARLVVVEDRTPFEHTGAYVPALLRTGRLDEDEAAVLVRCSCGSSRGQGKIFWLLVR